MLKGKSSAEAGGFSQTLVICRHSERRDQVDPSYKLTDEHKKWPWDTPLTEAGIKLAYEVGLELKQLHSTARFAAVVSSPYRRCMQTTAQVVKALGIPVIIDQEVGEVWDKDMPSKHPPHRSPKDLQRMARQLGMKVRNPTVPEGGYKLMGKQPTYPEITKDGHQRCLTRVEHYIEESNKMRQNYIIITHAPAVAACLDIFQHGFVDIDKLEYCARVTATRKVDEQRVKKEAAIHKSVSMSVFAEQWDVDTAGVNFHLNIEAEEEGHRKTLENTEEMRRQRLGRNTQSDEVLEQILEDVLHDKDCKNGDSNGNAKGPKSPVVEPPKNKASKKEKDSKAKSQS